MTEEVILDPPKVGIKLKAENVDIAYPPLFQSGGSYDLKLNAACDDNALHDGEAAGSFWRCSTHLPCGFMPQLVEMLQVAVLPATTMHCRTVSRRRVVGLWSLDTVSSTTAC
jgi:hypothetical protein